MENIFQIYVKRPNENTFVDAGIINRFYHEDEAVARCEALYKSWKDLNLGYEYIIVKVR